MTKFFVGFCDCNENDENGIVRLSEYCTSFEEALEILQGFQADSFFQILEPSVYKCTGKFLETRFFTIFYK